MLLPQNPICRLLATLCFALGTGACAQDPPDTAAVTTQATGCMATGDGSLQAELRGALIADLMWQNAQMECDGGMRPSGDGIRVTMAGPLPAHMVATSPGGPDTAPSKLRFIFGIDLHDTASGVAEAFPANLTVIVEGGQQLYATQGDDKCAVETLQRSALPASTGKLERVQVRGYCTGPASDLSGNSRLFVPTFSFTALIHTGDNP